MACKYTVTLGNGKEITLLSVSESFNGNDSIESFKESLEEILRLDLLNDTNILNNLLKDLENSEKKPLDLDNFNFSTAIGTTNVYYLNDSIYKIPDNENQNKLVDGINKITNWIKNNSLNLNFPNIFTNNIIAASFESTDLKNELTKYHPDRRFLLIDVNNLKNNKYENIFKSFIDYSLDMLRNDSDFVDSIVNTFKYKSYDDFINEMVNLPNNYNTNHDLLLYYLENKFNLNKGVLLQLYQMHGSTPELPKFNESLKTNKNNSLENQALVVYQKYSKFAKSPELYYSENQESEEFPFIQSGDLIKLYDTNYLNGVFYIYVGSYEGKTLPLKDKTIITGREHVIISPNGNKRTVSDKDLFKKIKNEKGETIDYERKFIYKKNISTSEINVNENINKNKDLINDFYSLNFNTGVSLDILKILQHGDLIYIKKSGTKNPMGVQVLGIFGNNLITADKNGNKFTYNLNSLPKIESIKLLKENYNKFVNLENIENYYNLSEGFINNKITDTNKQEILNNVKVGDIVRTLSKDGNAVFHNIIVGFNNDKSEFIILNNKQKVIKIDSNQVLNVIYNFKNSKNIIAKAVSDKDRYINIFNDFKNKIYPTYAGNLKHNEYVSVLDVSIPSIYTNDLKSKIEPGDFITINKLIYSVLNISPTSILVFDNNNKITNVKFEDITHIIKNNFKLEFENKTIEINSWLIGSDLDNNFLNVFKSGDFKLKEVKYVKSKTLPESIKYSESGNIVGAYWVTLSEFETLKEGVNDLTEIFSQKEFGEKRKMYAIEAITKESEKEFRLKNLKGYKKINNINSVNINDFMNLASKGMMINLMEKDGRKDFKTYRIEHVQNKGQNQGLFISYSILDAVGKTNSFIDFISKDDLTLNNNVNLYGLYSPHYFNVNKKLQTFANISGIKQNLVTENDKIEAFLKIGEYLSETFGIDMNIISSNEIPKNILNKNAEEIKAYILNGKIYINYDNASLSDPLHEFMHLVLGTMKITNPNEYLILLNNAKKHPEFNNLLDLYKDNTKLDIYEEIFIDLFTKTIKKELNDFKLFNISNLDSILKNTISKLFNLGQNLDNISGIDLFDKSVKDIINEKNSNLFLNPISYIDLELSQNSIKISTLKRKMLEDNSLEEKCHD